MSRPVIVTHAGAFHSDEVMAIALLERFWFDAPCVVARQQEEPAAGVAAASPWSTPHRVSRLPYESVSDEQVEKWISGAEPPPPSMRFDAYGWQDLRTPVPIIRTRREKWLQMARKNPDVFIVDVGGVHDPEKRNFDHHQRNFTETWENGCPLSSTGLIWRWLNEKKAFRAYPEEWKSMMVERVIRPLDAHDNGVAVSPLAAIMAPYNRVGVGLSQDRQFERALAMMHEVWSNESHACFAILNTHATLSKAWRKAQVRGEDFVVLRQSVADTRAAHALAKISNGQAKVMAIPGRGKRWSVISMPGNKGGFSIKCPIPEEWRGKFNKTVNVNGKSLHLAFGHKSGFMCSLEGSRKDAVFLCRYLSKRQPDPPKMERKSVESPKKPSKKPR